MPGPHTHKIPILCVLTFTLWAVPFTSLATTLYAKQDQVKVTAKPSPSSAVVTKLSLGDSVTVLAKKGRVLKVKTSGNKVGWVFKFRLSAEKPSTRSGSRLSGLTGRRTLAAREARAGGSIRGLKESTEQYAKSKQIKPEHQQAVDKMEALTIPEDELMQFKKDGQLGEFAGGAE